MKIAGITCAAGVATVAGIALAPVASAQTPPIAEGAYTMTANGASQPEVISYNCGPDCFVMDNPTDPKTGTFYHFDPASGQWQAHGIWTVDGFTYTAPSGAVAVLTPA